jgi:hypothetical protein
LVFEEAASYFEEVGLVPLLELAGFVALNVNFPFDMQFFFSFIFWYRRFLIAILDLNGFRLNSATLNLHILQILEYRPSLLWLFFI